MIDRTELGCYGHFANADGCRWHRHTQIGDLFRVSSVGGYFPFRERESIGAGAKHFFETMVFPTTGAMAREGCGCHSVAAWDGIEIERYETVGEAQQGHERIVERYMVRVMADLMTEVKP